MKKLLGLTLGVALALVLGEQAAAMRDHGGFPHYNGYVADPALGVRLIPDFDTVLAFADNPRGAIHVNHQGYRGADWPEGRTGEIVVIGDSQAFGLGVGDGDTLPALLEAATGRPTLNMGVPTYGPAEYLALIDEVAARKPATIVLVLNFANDLFELGTPNPIRHVVLDGWAIRGDTPPDAPQFPGRSWLFQKSHLVYAARALLHAPDEQDPQVEDASPSPLAAELPIPAPAPQAISADEIDSEVSDAVSELNAAEIRVIDLWLSVSEEEVPYAWRQVVSALRGGARVGDIVQQNFAEESVRIQLTAEWLKIARRLQREAPEQLAAWVAKNARHSSAAAASAALDGLDKARKQVATLDGLAPSDGARPSAFRGFLLDASHRARGAGAELAIVALPLDVQVDPAEFKKYGAPEQDLSETTALLTDLCADANRLGARCVDPTDALRAGNPGMFLNKDIHLTPAGQGVVARALAETLAQPAPTQRPIVGLPPGRSRLPTEEEWQLVPENLVKGSSSNNCQTRTVREYLVVDCKRAVTGITSSHPTDRLGGMLAQGLAPLSNALYWDDQPIYSPALRGLTVLRGPLDRLAWATEDRAVLVVPMLPGREIVADFFWADRTMRLTVPAGPASEGQPIGAFEPADATAPQISATAPPAEAPACGPEQVQAGAARSCLHRCDSATPCETGECTDWLGMNLCI